MRKFTLPVPLLRPPYETTTWSRIEPSDPWLKSMPRQNTHPTTQWQAGQIVDDRHVLPLDLEPGEYHVVLGMYHLASGQRLPVYEPDDTPVTDDSILLDLGFRVY